MNLDHLDFAVFQSRLALCLDHRATLPENLRVVMGSVLWKALDYSGCLYAMHLFVNSDFLRFLEVHALVVGRNKPASLALAHEDLRRAGGSEKGLIPRSELPTYVRLEIERNPSVFGESHEDISRWAQPATSVETEVRSASADLVDLLERLNTKVTPATGVELELDQPVVVIPIAHQAHPRLGCLLLWGGLLPADNPLAEEARFAFGRGVSQFVVRLFSCFYRMQPNTYLPSYYCPCRKHVALLWTELRNYEKIAELIRHRRDMDDRKRAAALKALIDAFAYSFETAIATTLGGRGRIDQFWGGSLLAVFGEYLVPCDQPDVAACGMACQVASKAVDLFAEAKDRWLQRDFDQDAFKKEHTEQSEIALAIGVHFGEVQFDYVGGPSHNVYLALGDEVTFVRLLTARAGRTATDLPLGAGGFGVSQGRLEEPIIVSQPAFVRADAGFFQDLAGAPAGSHRSSALVYLGDPPRPFPVYPLQPGNVVR